MTFTPIPSISGGDEWTASQGTVYLKDNLDFLNSTRAITLPVLSAITPQTLAPAGLSQIETSDATPIVLTVASFDADTDENIMFQFGCPADYTNTPVLELYYYMTSATSGSVVWGAKIAAISSSDSVLGKTFASANTKTSAVPSGTAGVLKLESISLTNDDGMTAGDVVTLLVYREGTSVSDTATGDANLIHARLTYKMG